MSHYGLLAFALLVPLAIISQASGADIVATDAAQAGPDFAIQGEYVGTLSSQTSNVGIQVIALGNGKYQAVMYRGGLPGDGWDKSDKETADGATQDGVTTFSPAQGTGWQASIKGGMLTLTPSSSDKPAELKKIDRKSQTLGAKPPQGAIALFDGTGTDHWQEGKMTEDRLLSVPAVTKQNFNDFTLHMEFRTPFMPSARGQARGNSGVYLQRRYECQILDSFGLKGADNECGGFYKQKAPDVNMCFPPLSWQTYDIEFTAARHDANGKKTANARVTVQHNGVLIHKDFELTQETAGEQKEAPGPGPIFFQDHSNPVHFRNVWIVEKKAS